MSCTPSTEHMQKLAHLGILSRYFLLGMEQAQCAAQLRVWGVSHLGELGRIFFPTA